MKKEFSEGDAINHRYRVVKRLGSGAMGTVYLTEDVVKVHRLVALKVLDSDRLDDPDYWSKGEYEALIRLRHPNLARVYDFGRIHDSNDYYIVSEYIRGTDLQTASNNLGDDELLDVIAQMSRALEYIHTQGYVHFDVKPDNVLITRQRIEGEDEGSKVQWNPEAQPSTSDCKGPPKVKLIDFGLAERITGSFDFAIKGTMNYVAPEIIRGHTPDRRADLYSMGVTLYSLFAESFPFVDEEGKPSPRHGNWREEIRRAIDDRPEYLQEIVVKLLESDPEQRFSSAREIIQALNAGAGQCYQIETAETQASYLYCSRVVGRKKELNRLKEEAEAIFSVPLHQSRSADRGDTTVVTRLLRSDRKKQTPLFCISGEIGIGKSRLFEEFTYFLRMREIPVHLGNCYETSHDPYQPFREIISQVATSIGHDSEVCQKYMPLLRRVCPRLRDTQGDTEETGARPDKERLYFIDGLANFLLDAAVSKPCVIAINNLHWVDEASVELLAHLMDVLGKAESQLPCGVPLMVVATQRSDESMLPGLRMLIAELREEERIRDIVLRRFSRTQIAELIHSMLQIEEIATPFLNRLEERTSGNPMFLVETLKTLQEEGIIARDGEDWRIRGDLTRIEIPHGIEATLLRRVRVLEAHQRSLLEALAVYDKPMSGKLLERLPEFDDTSVMAGLRDLQNRGMVAKCLDGGRLHFSIEQPKLREIVYEHIAEERCKVLHRQVAELLAAEHTGNEEEIIDDLAYHYQRSDQVGRALEYTMRAGDIMRRIFAHERAVEHYRHVLLQTGGSSEHFDIWIKTHERIGDIGTISGDYDLAVKSFDTLLQGDVRERLPLETRCRLLRKRGKIDEIQGEYTDALRSYKDARDLLEGAGDSALDDERTRVFNAIGWAYVCMGKYEKAMTICVEALRVMEGVVEKNEHAMLFATIGKANFYKGNIDQAVEFHSRALEIRENLENIPEIIISLNNLGDAYLASGEFVEALRHFQQALGAAEEVGDAFGRAMALHHLAETHYRLGDDDRAEVFVRESLRLSRSFKMRFLNNQNYFVRGKLLARRGDLGKAEANLYRTMGVCAKQGNRWGLARCLLEVASVQLRRGEAEEALRQVHEALESAHMLNIPYLEARCRLAEVRALRVQGETPSEELLARLDSAASLLDSQKNVELRGSIEVERGEVLVAMRDLDAAREAYGWAEQHFREIADRLPAESREAYLALHHSGLATNSTLEFREVPELPTVKAEAAPAPAPPPALSDEQQELLRVASLLQEMASAGGSRVFLQKVLTCVVQASAAEHGFLLACDGDEIRILGAVNSRGEVIQSPGDLISLAALEASFDGYTPILAPRVLDHRKVQRCQELYEHNVTRLAILPLKTEGTMRGALYLNNPDAAHLTPPQGSAILVSYQSLLALLLPRPVNA
ncbi:MAG: tetratricopeptide repeat protein [Planctomycetota bacterium]